MLRALGAACYRIRWAYHADFLDYNLGGFLEALVARVLFNLLNKRMQDFCCQRASWLPGCRHTSRIDGYSLRLFWRLQWRLGALGHVSHDLLFDGLKNVFVCLQGKSTKSVQVSKLRERREPGLHLATIDEIYESAEIAYSRLPLCIRQHFLERRIQRRVCWHCDRRCEKTHICGACRLARYCSGKCQDESWRAHHRRACKILLQQQDTLLLAQFRSECEKLESQHHVCTYAQAWKMIWANSLPSSRTTSRRLSRKTRLNKFLLINISK